MKVIFEFVAELKILICSCLAQQNYSKQLPLQRLSHDAFNAQAFHYPTICWRLQMQTWLGMYLSLTC